MTTHREDVGLDYCSTLSQVEEYVREKALELLQTLPEVCVHEEVSELDADSKVLSLHLHDNRHNIVATELNAEDCQALGEVFQVGSNTQFSRASTFINASYDVVMAVEVIEHLENPSLFLIEANKLLKPNGILIFSVPSVFGLEFRLKVLRGYAPLYSWLLENHLLPKTGLQIVTCLMFSVPSFNWIASLKAFLLTRLLFPFYECGAIEARILYACRPVASEIPSPYQRRGRSV